jgi:crotonobetainyl-CoA:carnitine CoA-transferase CaiB-like acyl-CoA transferase
MSGILEGIRVLDFGRYIAGPYCAALLAEYGAEVIRIEKRQGSEDRYQTPVSDIGDGALFLQMNRGKLGMTVDPMTDDGREIVRRLVATADVVIANLPPQTLNAMRLDYESLTTTKPDIILTTVSAYGRGGPYSERVGFDGVGQVMSGAVYLSGEPDRPSRAAVPWVDFSTALHCAFGTMAALMARQKTGRGQVVESALLASALTLTNATLIEQAVIKPDRIPTGNRGQTAGPTNLFRAKDGWILAQVIGQQLFKRWAKLMGEDCWLTDPRFKDDQARGDHGVILGERMNRWCAERTVAEALDILGNARIPAAAVLSPQQALDDPHVQAMGFLEPTDYPGLPRPAPIARVPVWLSGNTRRSQNRAPTLGEHTEQIMADLGYDVKEIAMLRKNGII